MHLNSCSRTNHKSLVRYSIVQRGEFVFITITQLPSAHKEGRRIRYVTLHTNTSTTTKHTFAKYSDRLPIAKIRRSLSILF